MEHLENDEQRYVTYLDKTTNKTTEKLRQNSAVCCIYLILQAYVLPVTYTCRIKYSVSIKYSALKNHDQHNYRMCLKSIVKNDVDYKIF